MRAVVKRLGMLVAACAVSGAASNARAVIQYSSSTRLTKPPTGAYANSGWQWQGQFGSFLGTAISKKFFITAGHIGGRVGDNFIINGNLHRTVQVWDDPQTDLRIYQTVGSFLNVAPLFKDATEVGRTVTIFGRGTQRGDEVRTDGVLNGWQWGDADGEQSWGRNAISGVVDGGKGTGPLLKLTFDANGGSYEGALTGGDSGGGMFIKHGAYWKLAGINYSVDGPYNDGANAINAALFNTKGIATDEDAPGAFYTTRISPRVSWIADVLNGRVAPGLGPVSSSYSPVPEPTGVAAAIAVGMCSLATRIRRAQ